MSNVYGHGEPPKQRINEPEDQSSPDAPGTLSLALSDLDRLQQELAEWQIEAHKARADKYEILVESLEWRQRYKDEIRRVVAAYRTLKDRDGVIVALRAELDGLKTTVPPDTGKSVPRQGRAFNPEPDPPDMNYALHSAFVEVNLAAREGPLSDEFLLAAVGWLIEVHNKDVATLTAERCAWEKTANEYKEHIEELNWNFPTTGYGTIKWPPTSEHTPEDETDNEEWLA